MKKIFLALMIILSYNANAQFRSINHYTNDTLYIDIAYYKDQVTDISNLANNIISAKYNGETFYFMVENEDYITIGDVCIKKNNCTLRDNGFNYTWDCYIEAYEYHNATIISTDEKLKLIKVIGKEEHDKKFFGKTLIKYAIGDCEIYCYRTKEF